MKPMSLVLFNNFSNQYLLTFETEDPVSHHFLRSHFQLYRIGNVPTKKKPKNSWTGVYVVVRVYLLLLLPKP